MTWLFGTYQADSLLGRKQLLNAVLPSTLSAFYHYYNHANNECHSDKIS